MSKINYFKTNFALTPQDKKHAFQRSLFVQADYSIGKRSSKYDFI